MTTAGRDGDIDYCRLFVGGAEMEVFGPILHDMTVFRSRPPTNSRQ